MIFDHIADDMDDLRDLPGAHRAGQLLRSCVTEAARLALALERLDHQIADLVVHHAVPSGLLQQVDLARQEAGGLAAVLEIIADAPTQDHLITAESVARVVRMQAQHVRLSVPGGAGGPALSAGATETGVGTGASPAHHHDWNGEGHGRI